MAVDIIQGKSANDLADKKEKVKMKCFTVE